MTFCRITNTTQISKTTKVHFCIHDFAKLQDKISVMRFPFSTSLAVLHTYDSFHGELTPESLRDYELFRDLQEKARSHNHVIGSLQCRIKRKLTGICYWLYFTQGSRKRPFILE